MISYIETLMAGGALRLYLTPPNEATSWRVLRRTNPAAFTGPDDPGAAMVVDRTDANVVMDAKGLSNGATYHYRVYYRGRTGAWIGHDEGQGVPQASYAGDDADPQTVLRDRLEAGLKTEVQRGALLPQSGKIQVVTAPFAMVEHVTFPCVSVHLESDLPAYRGIGESFGDGEVIEGVGWDDGEGWLSRVVLRVVAVSLNGDERIALRRAIKRIVIANLPVFKAAGLDQVEFSLSDHEDEGPKNSNAILFMSVGQFSCIAPSYASHRVGPIRDVEVSASAFFPSQESNEGNG
ncbi:conserved protein of unknown function (plasmid) [Rhodovastum atsumiense]|uniref:Uncharacterized protein n=1 Tax=Rhodovastum atsumiense TaxID=504468 RepID=A0A5M6ITE4_9PROT|nr:hypothetical protein [Rhodovastum atsumiense]KAA5611583.1 hypothetical protein F1189_13545 [Rhodovastum atsumiense]CAH2606334.1 conserved protein of unknown function [Rhodovastum atsumiense]